MRGLFDGDDLHLKQGSAGSTVISENIRAARFHSWNCDSADVSSASEGESVGAVRGLKQTFRAR